LTAVAVLFLLSSGNYASILSYLDQILTLRGGKLEVEVFETLECFDGAGGAQFDELFDTGDGF
jgi:hypothetical protein